LPMINGSNTGREKKKQHLFGGKKRKKRGGGRFIAQTVLKGRKRGR